MQLRIPGFPSDAADGIGGGPILVRNGNPVQQADEQFTLSHLNRPHPRRRSASSASGASSSWSADGSSSLSRGLTNWALAQQMVRLGAVTAMGFDGGGSSTIAFQGKVLNRPSDGVPRAVAEGLFVFYYGIYAPQASRTLITPNGDAVSERTTLSAKVVRPSVIDLKLLRPNGTVAWRSRRGSRPGTFRKVVGSSVMGDGVSALGRGGDRKRERARQHHDAQLQGEPHAGPAAALPRPAHHYPGAHCPGVRLGRAQAAGHGGVAALTRSGQVRKILFQGARGRGKHVWSWDGRRAAGVLVPRGTYVVRVRATNSFGTLTLRDTVRVVRTG